MMRTAAWVIGVGSVCAGILAGVFWSTASDPVPPAAVPNAVTALAGTPPPTRPSFDIVRVPPSGDAVLAGRAQPGSQVEVSAAGKVVATATADASGAWAATAAMPPDSGAVPLTLSSRSGSAAAVAGEGAVVITPSVAGEKPVAVALLPRAAPTVLQAPPTTSGPVGLDALSYDDRGAPRFAGHAAPGSTARLAVDGAPVGEAVADAAGRWTMTPNAAIKDGPHNLRVDQLANGRATASASVPFMREAASPSVLAALSESGGVVVQPGQNLWRIARASYGRGLEYTIIYAANRDHIANPDRIFPGQALTVPASAGAPRP